MKKRILVSLFTGMLLVAAVLSGSRELCTEQEGISFTGKEAMGQPVAGISVPADGKPEETAPAPGELYAMSAVLMDGDSGRVLYGKNETEIRPMASTTKIMTCIVALEEASEDTVVTVSERAASQPKVHLAMRAGEEYRLGDLLYSLMLESHNDSAVAVAEAVAGSVEAFTDMMNRKAEEIGCSSTCFLTPNGLDETKETAEGTRTHSTTAEELARIMRYCTMESPKKEEFRRITGTKNYSFTANGRSYSCYNHNAFLSMMDGAFSGKTGFTGEAGYCYVGALERDGKTLIVALLACGWPNNKTYKWSDTKKLMAYGLSAYEYRDIYVPQPLPELPVENGIPENGELTETAVVPLSEVKTEGSRWKLLMREEEQAVIEAEIPEGLPAPVAKGQKVGTVRYFLDGKEVASSEICAARSVEKLTFSWCVSKITENFFINF